MRLILLSMVLAVTACAKVSTDVSGYTVADFAHLKFLEGRWEGTGPDGTKFHEQYAFENPRLMRSTRYDDARFSSASDGSSVDLNQGKVTSRWNEFTWEASELAEGRACFEPVKAPSSFCWERIDASTVHVTQRWTGDDGIPQTHVVPMRRL